MYPDGSVHAEYQRKVLLVLNGIKGIRVFDPCGRHSGVFIAGFLGAGKGSLRRVISRLCLGKGKSGIRIICLKNNISACGST